MKNSSQTSPSPTISSAPSGGAPSSAAAPAKVLKDILAVRIGPFALAFEMRGVVGLTSQSHASAGPGDSNFLLGLIRFQRRDIPLCSLAPKLGLKDWTHDSRMALTLSLGGAWISIAIDSIVEVDNRERIIVEALPEGLSEIGKDILTGWASFGEQGAFVLDLEHLFTDDELAILGEFAA